MSNYPIQLAEAQHYIVVRKELNFNSFALIGQILQEDAADLEQLLHKAAIPIRGPLEMIYQFADDPHGEDLSDGKFSIHLGFPVDEDSVAPPGYERIHSPAYHYIAHRCVWPPYEFGWMQLRESADRHGYSRSLQEREVHLKLKSLGDNENCLECRLVLEASCVAQASS